MVGCGRGANLDLGMRPADGPERRFALLMVFTAFYEQLAWAPILVLFATAAGSAAALAYAASAYSAANLVGNALFGLLVDRKGRIPTAAVGFLALAASALLHLAVRTPASLVGVRLLHGLAAAAVAPAVFASLAHGVPRERRGEAMARAGLLIAVASMFAPPVTGAIEGAIGLQGAVVTLAAGVALVGALAVRHAARQKAAGAAPGPAARASVAESSPAPAEAAAARLVDARVLALACSLGFAVMFCQNILFYAFPLKANALGLAPSMTGALLSAFALGAVIAFASPLSRLADRRGRKLPALLGLAVASGGFLSLGASERLAALALSLAAYGLGFGLLFPTVSALAADSAGEGRRGAAFGLLTAAFSAGSITGPLVAQGLNAVLAPFTVGGLLLALALTLSAAGLRGRKSEAQSARA